LPRLPLLLVIALALVVAAVGWAGCGGEPDPLGELKRPELPEEDGDAESFALSRVASGLDAPTWVGSAPGDGAALWVLQQAGTVIRLEGETRETLLDLRPSVKSGGEQGLLGIAFHPDFERNRRLYLHWSDPQGDTRVAEFRTVEGGFQIQPGPERQLLFLDQPAVNHNGGQLAFGPDGRLYLGLGDGGGNFDPRRTAQDPRNKLGKLLSLDVDSEQAEWRVELLGLRNPWRFAFDGEDLWIPDVGQGKIEEVNRVRLDPSEPPQNLGWSAFEGTRRVNEEGRHDLNRDGALVWPATEYGHGDGCSITAGFVYRGQGVPRLAGRYLYGDWCSGNLWSLREAQDLRVEDVRREEAELEQVTHIGPDGNGEPVLAAGDGAIYRAVAP